MGTGENIVCHGMDAQVLPRVTYIRRAVQQSKSHVHACHCVQIKGLGDRTDRYRCERIRGLEDRSSLGHYP